MLIKKEIIEDKIDYFDPYFGFHRQVAKSEHRLAVEYSNTLYTYGELNRRVSAIASVLAQRGIKKGDVVALALGHNINLIAAPLAALKLGAVYLPVDTRLPQDRLSYICNDANPSVLLVDEILDGITTPENCKQVVLGEHNTTNDQVALDSVEYDPANPAYIIYTSGSTGVPKGVVVTRGNITNYCAWAATKYFDSPSDRIALYSTLSFDFTATCLFPPLSRGCCIDLYDGIKDPFIIKKIIEDGKAEIIKITPAYLEILASLPVRSRALKRLIVGGEDLKVGLAQKVTRSYPSIEIINEYGPTEASVGCMNYTYSLADSDAASVPIGQAIDGVIIELLDEECAPVAVGETGEIFIFGDSVAKEYLGKEDATRSAFLSLPIHPNIPCYRTGDFARRLSDHCMVFAGRRDDQVKIRGHRVELGEIQAVLIAISGVTTSHVFTVSYLSTNELVAAVVLDGSHDVETIVAELKARLLGYMIPRKILTFDKLPMTNNQKVDTNKLVEATKERINGHTN